jgi:hypothetical protein
MAETSEVEIVRIPVVVPSHKRWDKVVVKRAVAGVILCVPESQADLYREHNGDVEIVSHPDSIKGLSLKRQWILEHWGGEVFQIDDDVDALLRMYLEPNDFREMRVEPDRVRTLIDHTAYMARQMGAFLFGFNASMDARDYTGIRPFRLKGYCLGAGIGILRGSKLRFSDRVVAGTDFYISLLNAYHHRHAMFDLRFGWRALKTFKNAGGMSEYQTPATEQRDYETLRRMFGDAVVPKKKPRPHKYSHEWEKMMHLPF